MSIYFDSKVVLPDSTNYGFGKRIFIDIEWHKKYPLLAISHSDDKSGPIVSVYNHEKEETTNIDSTPQPGVQITGIAWHPLEKLLAICYETGEVIVWNHDEGEVFEGSKGHSSAVMLMEWSFDGSLLVSSDSMGILIIWKSDLQGHLQTQAIHDFKDPVCNIVFRQKRNLPQRDDETERALEMMTSWRPKTGRKRGEMSSRRDSIFGSDLEDEKCFFVGVLSGTIYYLKEGGSSEEILSSGSCIRSLLYYLPKDTLVVMTEAQIMGQFQVDANGNLKEINKMKISGQGEMHLFWIGSNTLAVVGKEPYVRLWDVESNYNTVLETRRNEVGEDESFLSIDYHPLDGILCCCTNKGKLVMWKEIEPALNEDGENRQTQDDHWEYNGVTLVPSSSKLARWCVNTPGLIAVNAIQDIVILMEQSLCFYFGQKISVVQILPNQLSVSMLTSKKTFEIKTDIQIRGITASGSHIAIWNNTKVVVYEIGETLPSNYKYTGSFGTKAEAIMIQDLSLYLQEIGQIQVRSFQGTIKQTLPFNEEEGPPITMALGGDFFTTGTEYGFLKIWHIGRREAKLHTTPKNLNDHIKDLGEIINANTNFDGTKVGFVVAKVNLVPDSRFFVMDITMNIMTAIEFPNRFIERFVWEVQEFNYIGVEVRKLSKEVQEIIENEMYKNLQDESKMEKKKEQAQPMERIIIDVITGKLEKVLLHPSRDWEVINEKPKSKTEMKSGDKVDLPDNADQVILTMFTDMEKGILVHEIRTDLSGKCLVGLEVPYLYLAENGAWKQKKPMLKDTKENNNRSSLSNAATTLSTLKLRIEREIIQDFDGFEEEGKEGKEALMQYVYLRLCGDVDGALKAIKSISKPQIYENMLKNCVKTKRLDVAFLCLAKLKEARKAREVRQAMRSELELNAAVAMLAIQLNMLDEAERLYMECERYDLLLRMFVITHQWDRAITLCEKHRRIQLKTTYHAYAKCLEADKKIPEAIEMYEKAETHRYEVPRMLLDEPDQLQAYVVKKKDKELYQWWAQYLESTGEVQSALRYYELGHDWLSLVRLLCYLGNYEGAVKMAEKAEDKASAYHLARTLEDKGEFNMAINFYSRAGAYGHAVRTCRENNMPEELWTMAQQADTFEQVEAARYFETETDPPFFDRAIRLYHKAGYDSKALDLAFSSQQFSALQSIVKDIMTQSTVNTDPLLLQKCANFFLQNGEIDKALDMLCAAQKYPEAMELCVEQNFTITDEIAERLTAPKGGIGLDEQTRIKLLEKMGECCTLQGSYHLAAKKYTQAGNKIQAMKSLMKSGDTDKIIFYANVSRHREIYMLGANYLQSTEWSDKPEIIKKIVHYYTKAQAYDSLSRFYVNVAESAIEENRDYRTALEEYQKADSSLQDLLACGARQYEDDYETNQLKMHNISKYLIIKDKIKTNPDAALLDLKKLIEDPKSEIGIRTGDIYGLIVEHYANQGEVQQALTVLEEMRKFIPTKNLNKFLSPEAIHKMEGLMKNTSIFREKSGDQITAQQRSLPIKQMNPLTPSSSLSFLNKDMDEAMQSSRDKANIQNEEEGEVDEENEYVEEIDEEEEIIEDEEETDEDEDEEEDDLANKNPSQKLQYQSLFGNR